MRRLVELGRNAEVAREMVERPERQDAERGVSVPTSAEAAALIVPSPPPTIISGSPRSTTARQRTSQSPPSISSTSASIPAALSAAATLSAISGSRGDGSAAAVEEDDGRCDRSFSRAARRTKLRRQSRLGATVRKRHGWPVRQIPSELGICASPSPC